MTAADAGFRTLKLFPAEAAGGLALLRAFADPLPELRFCPTGGIGAASFRRYLELPNVLCVGGSWVAPHALVAAGDWGAITALAQEVST
jgi:2-dehydro-3-deoxyphosphogluconate aldolase/(4S)-4-hydroxy-2-oxoglutarate aldolase